MRELFAFQTNAQEMIAADRERDQMLRAMDDMWQARWALPPTVAGLKWIHKVVSSDPHDAVRAGTRVLSSVAPRLTIHPLGVGEEGRTQAEQVERALAWNFRNASRRRQASVLRDVVLSALLYDEVVAQVVYLPQQLEAMKPLRAPELGRSYPQDRLQAASRFGPFAIIVRNPQQVHVRYSDWMPEAVLMKRVMTMQQAAEFWGDRADELIARGTKAKRSKRAGGLGRKAMDLSHCTMYDYMDLEQRVVWAIPQPDGAALSDPAGSDEAGAVEILREEHGLGFLPWAAKVGGTTLTQGEGRGSQRIPLLYSIWAAGQWDTQNIVETLMTSEVIAYAAAPRMKVEGPSDSVEVDYGEPGRVVHVPPGHTLDALTPPGLDQGLATIAQRVGERIGKSTVPRVLQTGDFPASTAFATLNLATQSGIKALAPYKELAEDALAEVFTLMLNWLQFSGQPLEAVDSRRGRGEKIRVGAKDLADLVVDVELTADVPSDRMARINAASMAVRDLGYSRERALEQIGETDAREVMRQAAAEELEAVELEIEKQRMLALAKREFEPREKEEESQASDAGQGFNPALAGTPPVIANPDAVAQAKTQTS
jgi:hypothetical protein